MLFQPAIIALLLASALCVLALAASAPFRRAGDPALGHPSGSERQLQLERRTYLFSTLLVFVLALQLAAVLLFVFNAEKMSGMFVGAMCAVGTLNVNAFGFPALNAKIAVFFLAAMWLAINHVDSRARDYPLVRIKYGLLLLLAPLLVASFWIELQYFLGLKADVITSCCGSLFSEGSPTLAAEASALAAAAGDVAVLRQPRRAIAVAAWHGYRRRQEPRPAMRWRRPARWLSPRPSPASSPSSRSTSTSTRTTIARSASSSPNTATRATGSTCRCSPPRGGAGGRRGAALRPHRQPARHRAGLLAQSRRHRGERLRLDRRDRHGDDLAIPPDFAGALMRILLVLSCRHRCCWPPAAATSRRPGSTSATSRRYLPDLPRRRHARALPRRLGRQAAGDPLLGRLVQVLRRRNEGHRKVYQRLKPRGLDVIAINAGQDRKTVVEFMKKLGVSYPALMDENSAIAKRYGVVGLPTTYFRRRQGHGARQADRRGRRGELRARRAGSPQMSEAWDPKAPCDLCSLPVGIRPFTLATPGKTFRFCCEGCKGIYQMLHQINETPVGTADN
jgi:hypothetical protein